MRAKASACRAVLLAVFVLSSCLSAAAQETFSNYINGLPAAGTVNSPDYLYVLQGGVSKKAPVGVVSPPAITGGATINDLACIGPSATQAQDCTSVSGGIVQLGAMQLHSLQQPVTAAAAFIPEISLQRIQNYSGGLAIDTNAVLSVLEYTSPTGGYSEWPITSVMYNQTFGSPQNVAIQGTAFKQYKPGYSYGANQIGRTWAANFACQDLTMTVNPTASCIGAELDTYIVPGAGTDANKQRVGLDIAWGANNGLGTSSDHVGVGILFGSNDSTVLDRAIYTASNGNYNIGIDLSQGTFTTAPIFLGPGQPIALDGTSSGTFIRSLYYATGVLAYKTNHGVVFTVADTGAIESVGNNASGFTADGTQFLSQESALTAAGVYSPLVPAGWSYYDGARSVVACQNGSTVVGCSSYGAYLIDNVAHGGNGQNGILYWGIGVANVNSAKVWGLNPALDDNTTNTALATTGRTLIGAELDFTVNSNNGGTTIEGIALELNALNSQPTGNGFQVSISNASSYPWINAFVSDSGAAQVALIAGALAASGGNIAGQPIISFFRDGSGNGQRWTQAVDTSGNLAFTTTGTGKMKMPSLVLAGPIQLTSLQSGTPATYACFDSGGNLISSVSAC